MSKDTAEKLLEQIFKATGWEARVYMGALEDTGENATFKWQLSYPSACDTLDIEEAYSAAEAILQASDKGSRPGYTLSETAACIGGVFAAVAGLLPQNWRRLLATTLVYSEGVEKLTLNHVGFRVLEEEFNEIACDVCATSVPQADRLRVYFLGDSPVRQYEPLLPGELPGIHLDFSCVKSREFLEVLAGILGLCSYMHVTQLGESPDGFVTVPDKYGRPSRELSIMARHPSKDHPWKVVPGANR